MTNEHIEELARRLCAAYTSTRLGISMDWALKGHVNRSGKPISDYWIRLAEQVYNDWMA
jgi:hypothetical protein